MVDILDGEEEVINEIYTIVLSDGTRLENLRLNGNNFISQDFIDRDIFEANCSPVTIITDEYEEEHPNMELVQLTQYGSEYWFVLRDLSKAELLNIKTRSDIDYIALMCDVEL